MRLKPILVVAATIAVLWLLFRQIPLAEVTALFRRARWELLVAAAAAAALQPFLSALRWRTMLNLLEQAVPLRVAFNLIMAAWPVSSVTPSKSGDLIKAYYLKDRVPPGLTLGTVLVERAIDILVLLALSTAGAAVFHWGRITLISGALLIAALAGLTLLVATGDRWPLPRRVRPLAADLLRVFRELLAAPAALAVVLAFSAGKWLAAIVQTYLCFLALNHSVSLAQTAGALPLAIFVGLIPVTISGIGTRDGALVLLFRGHAPAEVALGVGLLYTLFAYWLPALAGFPFLKSALPGGRRELHEAERQVRGEQHAPEA
ncbi:MAG: flippase-like domain-containing protein [Candidatus Eisenbacteria bacterium]|nr:flippase-like domain-containing protein [Candidatus Eisenbacteria bacterium]